MIKELLEALESNKFITINLTQNGPLVMAVITGRSQKGADSPPLNVCVEPDELEKAVAAALTETWKKARQSDRRSEKEEKKPEPQPAPEEAPAPAALPEPDPAPVPAGPGPDDPGPEGQNGAPGPVRNLTAPAALQEPAQAEEFDDDEWED